MAEKNQAFKKRDFWESIYIDALSERTNKAQIIDLELETKQIRFFDYSIVEFSKMSKGKNLVVEGQGLLRYFFENPGAILTCVCFRKPKQSKSIDSIIVVNGTAEQFATTVLRQIPDILKIIN